MAEEVGRVSDGSDRMTGNWVEANSLNDRCLIFHSSLAEMQQPPYLPGLPGQDEVSESDFLSRELFIVGVRAERLFQSATQDSDRTGGSFFSVTTYRLLSAK